MILEGTSSRERKYLIHLFESRRIDPVENFVDKLTAPSGHTIQGLQRRNVGLPAAEVKSFVIRDLESTRQCPHTRQRP